MLLKVNLHYLVLAVLILVLVLGMSIKSKYFLTLANFDVLVNNYIMEAIMALGMTMVIISGGIDLSIAGILPFTAIIFAKMMTSGMNIPLAMIISLLVAMGIGFINNELRSKLNLYPMVVTLSTSLILKSINLVLTGGTVIAKFPASFKKIGMFKPLGITLSCWIYIILAVLFLYFSKNNKRFIQVFFVGGNAEAAKLSGMNTEAVYRFVYVMSAFLAGLAGILSTTVYNSASFSFGQGVELRVITAVAIGGTSMTQGGIGSIAGTMLGTLFLAIVYNAFVMSGMSTYYENVVTGGMLIVAILLSEGIRKIKLKQTQETLK
ncbi:MAG: ABC transporter permease [Firmicutes bacterium]|nr:ABC transporter permease [Bacillota bacterium]